MGNVNPNQCIGFSTQVADFLEQYKTQLVAKKYDPTDHIAELRADATALSQLDTEQEGLKTQLSNKTNQVDTRCGGNYSNASNKLDMAIGALGKGTPEGKEGTRIRKGLRGRGPNGNGGTTPPTPPTP